MAWHLLPLGIKPRGCASQDCGGAAAWELDVGDCASHYCNTCKTIIERGQRYFGSEKAIVSPHDDIYIKRLFVGDGS